MLSIDHSTMCDSRTNLNYIFQVNRNELYSGIESDRLLTVELYTHRINSYSASHDN